MIAVIFEVWPTEDGREPYLAIAAELRTMLDGIDGFLSIERFASLSEPEKVLSLSFWRDEEAVTAWRRVEAHRTAQAAGRGELFADYRLRIAGVIRDYGMTERDEAPADSRATHDVAVGGEESAEILRPLRTTVDGTSGVVSTLHRERGERPVG